MLTLGLLILAGSLGQAGAPLTADYASLQGTLVEIVVPPDAPLPPGWPETRRRSGRLDNVASRPRNPGENMLTVTWDEPWMNPATENLVDTIRDPAGRMYKLVIVPENDRDRIERIKHGWTERNYTLIGSDPLDARAWVPAEELKVAQQAQRMARDAAAATAPAEPAPAPQGDVAAPPTQAPAGFFTMRGPQLVIGLIALVLAAAVVKTLVL